MASRKLNDLYEPLSKVIKTALIIANARNLPITITCTLRTPSEQAALYAQGRRKLSLVNSLRKSVGLGKITDKENKRRITWTLTSYHNTLPKSMAVDFAIGKKKIYWDSKVDINNNEIPDYKEFADICKSINPDNIIWGGDWEMKDLCHLQWKHGKDINQSKPLSIPKPPTPPPIRFIKEDTPPEPIEKSKQKKKSVFLDKLFSIILRLKKLSKIK